MENCGQTNQNLKFLFEKHGHCIQNTKETSGKAPSMLKGIYTFKNHRHVFQRRACTSQKDNAYHEIMAYHETQNDDKQTQDD